MPKLTKLALLLVSLAIVLSACSPAAAPTTTPIQSHPLPAAPASKATPEGIAVSTTTNTVEVSRPIKTLAQQLPGETDIFLPLTMTPANPAPITEGFIADNRVIAEFSSIPPSAVDAAKARRVLFYHQSTGGYIFDSGLQCLAGMRGGWDGYPAECATYAQNPGYYGLDHWNWPQWPEAMADAPAKMDQFVNLVATDQQDYDIIGMKFCYVDGWNQDFEQYRTKMEALESRYPNKIFIWTTSALWADPGDACNSGFNSCKNISDFNMQVRTYALAHNKPVYDIAAIESDGGECQVAGYEGMCMEYYDSGGGHPTIAGSIRLAKGFWLLIAKLSGWN